MDLNESRNTPSRIWVFTLNNYTPDDLLRVQRWQEDAAILEAAVGEEVGESGTPHLQGFLRFTVTRRFTWVKQFVGDRAYIAICKSPEDAKRYAKKDGKILIDKNTPRRQGQRTDLDEARHAMDEGGIPLLREKQPNVLMRYPAGCRFYISSAPAPLVRDVKVFVYWNRLTGVGKSHAAHLTLPLCSVMFPPDSRSNPWFDNYNGEPHLLLDEFAAQIPYRFLLKLLDHYPMHLPVKGSTVAARYTRVTITSNHDPRTWYPNEDYEHLLRRLNTGGIFTSAPWGLGDLWVPRPTELTRIVELEPMCN